MLRLDPERLPDHLPLTFSWKRGPFSATASLIWQRTGESYSTEALFVARAPFKSFQYEARSVRGRAGLLELRELINGEQRQRMWQPSVNDEDAGDFIAGIETLHALISTFEVRERSIQLERIAMGKRAYEALADQIDVGNSHCEIRVLIPAKGTVTAVFDGRSGLPIALRARLPIVGEIEALALTPEATIYR